MTYILCIHKYNEYLSRMRGTTDSTATLTPYNTVYT